MSKSNTTPYAFFINKYISNFSTMFSCCNKCLSDVFWLLSGEFCEVTDLQQTPCQMAKCQNGAPCNDKLGTAICQCPPGFEGQSCEKLVSVNFVDRDSYVELQDVKNWPQSNITLQVIPAMSGNTMLQIFSILRSFTLTYWSVSLLFCFRCQLRKIMASCCIMVIMNRLL